ncbi:MAG TPA: hypothetical protein VM683_12870 [Anaeromyxobacteraceae bacterium]|jgi:hypothetical protein|nr:hypothetical protein [Anaeromyxobacteraceae bacterium]
MLRLLFGLALCAALAAAAAFVPLRGRTVLDRWRAAPDATTFATRSWSEAKAALGLAPEPPRPGSRPKARPLRSAARGARPAPPTEQHTDADRAALERVLAERAQR